jgi:hypothetical protein
MFEGGRHDRRRLRMRPSLSSARPRGVVVGLGVVLASLASGCGGDEAPPIDLGPTGEPKIAFASPAGDEPICVSIGDVDGRIPLVVETSQVVLNPPATCGTYLQCGHLVLYAEGVENNRSAVRGIDLLLHKLANPIFDGTPHAATGEPNLLDLRVEVVTDAADVLLDHAGEPVAADLSLVTVPDCESLDPAEG